MILTADQIIQELVDLGIDKSLIGEASDSQYFCPSYAWTETFLKWLTPQIQETLKRVLALKPQLTNQQEQGFDCDNCSRRVIDRATDFFILRNDLAFVADHAIFSTVIIISEFGKGLNGIDKGRHVTNAIRTSDRGWQFGEGFSGLLSDLKATLSDSFVIIRRFNLGV